MKKGAKNNLKKEDMMKKMPKPIEKAKDLKAGIPYFEVELVLARDKLYLEEPFVLKGRPYIRTTAISKTKILAISADGVSGGWLSLRDMGLSEKDECDNLHRTFRYNGKAYSAMKDIVERQDIPAYMQVIRK